MNKHTEKPQIDKLFADKLANMSMKPSPDSWEVLQAKMKGQEAKVVPLVTSTRRRMPVYWYASAAACILLVCLFGWLYWPSADSKSTEHRQENLAANNVIKNKADRSQNLDNASVAGSQKGIVQDELAMTTTSKGGELSNYRQPKPVNSRASEENKQSELTSPIEEKVISQPTSEPMVAQAPSLDKPVVPAQPEKTPATVVNEHTLIVKVVEPSTLVASNAERIMPATELKDPVTPEKQNKVGRFFEKVKRIKDGEVYAYNDRPAASSEEGDGLLDRLLNSNNKHNKHEKR